MGLFSSLLDQLERNYVNHALRSSRLPNASQGTTDPVRTSIDLQPKAKHASTAHAQHARRQRKPTSLEAGEAQPTTHRKRKAVEALDALEKVSKKTKVKRLEQHGELDAIPSHALSPGSYGHRNQKKDSNKDKSKNFSKHGGGAAGLLRCREGMIYKPGLSATPDLISMFSRGSKIFGPIDPKRIPDVPHPQFASFGFDKADPVAPAAGIPQARLSNTSREAPASDSFDGLSIHDRIIERAKSKKAKAATSAELLASMPKKTRRLGPEQYLPCETKRLLGTDIALFPCTLLWALDKRERRPLISGDEDVYNTALEPDTNPTEREQNPSTAGDEHFYKAALKPDINPVEELFFHYAASGRNPELPPVTASGVKRHMRLINGDGIWPSISNAVKSHYARSTAECHYKTRKIQNHKIRNGTSRDAIKKGCRCFKP